jgi:hypothetical protein
MNDIDLNVLSRDFHNMRRDVLWATCPHCESCLLPKIGVRLGNELNRYHKLQYETSSYEAIVLYSPFFLKYNYNNGLLKEFGNKLDVENFKMRFNAVFWDSIWYFKTKNLDFEFMLPYEYCVNLTGFAHVNDHIRINNIPTHISKYQILMELNNEKIINERRGTKDKIVKQIEVIKELKITAAPKAFKDNLTVQHQQHLDYEILPTVNMICDTFNNEISFSQDNTHRQENPTEMTITFTDEYSSNLCDSNRFLDIDIINDRKKLSCPLNIIREESRNTILSHEALENDIMKAMKDSPILPRNRTKMRSDFFLYQKGNNDNQLDEIIEFDDCDKDRTPV